MANLDDDKVLDVILGEAASVAKYGQQASYEDMLAIASSIANRAQRYNASPVEIARDKTQYHAQKPAPGMEAYRDLARQAVQQVMTRGPVHSGTYYHKSNTVPSSFEFATRTAAHTFYDDPQNRPIRTTSGVKRAASPQVTQASFSPAAIPVPEPSPRRSASYDPDLPERTYRVSRMNPILGPSKNLGSWTKATAPETMQSLLGKQYTAFEGQFREATGLPAPPMNDVLPKNNEGRRPTSQHFLGKAIDFSTRDLTPAEQIAMIQQGLQSGFTGFGLGRTIAHMDIGPARSWNYGNAKYAGIPISDWNEALARGTIPTKAQEIVNAAFTNVQRPDIPVPTPRAQALASMQVAARPQTATTPAVANPNSNVIAPVQTATTLAPVNTAIASRVSTGQTIAPVSQQTIAPNVVTGQRFSPVSSSQIAAPLRSAVVAPVAPSLAASRAMSDIARAPSLAFDPQVAVATKSPMATRPVQTSTVAPAVTATPVSARSSTPSARSAQEVSMAALNAITAQPLGRVPSPTPNPRGAYANRPADTPAMERAMAEATRGARVYDGTTAPANPVMGNSFRGFGAGGLLGNLLTGNAGVPGNRGALTGGLLGMALAGPVGGLLGAVIGGGGLRGIGEAIGSRQSASSDNSASFTAANPAGGRGLMDMSGGPVSIGSITAAPTPSSGGYRSIDSATGWSSYSNPQTGITTTFDAQGNTLGGPGMAPDVGGNSPGGK